MRIIHCHCSATYHGRGDTILPPATRIIMVKEDGTVSIHAETGMKPLNYMTGKVTHTTTTNQSEEQVLHFDTSKESLTITLHALYSDNNYALSKEEPGLIRDGTEDHLQEWLSENITVIRPGLEFVQREYETGDGKVDLLAIDQETNTHVLIEVKRVAAAATVYQVKRYIDAHGGNCEGIIVGLDIRPKTRILADKREIPWIELTNTPWNK